MPYAIPAPLAPFNANKQPPVSMAHPTPSKEELICAELQEATLDCRQMERNIKMLAEQKKISFEESLVKLHLKPLWEDVKERFAKAKEAFVLFTYEQQAVA